MTCGLHTKLDTAVNAAREAFDTAHEKDSLSDSDLNLLFVYYQGLKKIRESLPKNERPFLGEDLINVQFPDGTYDPDYNITVPTGDISFDTNNLAFDSSQPITFNVPETPTTDTVTFG